MAEAPSVTIPDKPAFKASEVCELAQIQPYVLRSWESEFPELGLSKTPGGPRIYRRTDVERVLRIRDLVFTEGLTLSGVRRRFDAEQPPPQDDLFSFVAEVQAAQAKAAQANAERRTLNAEAEPQLPARQPQEGSQGPLQGSEEASHAAAAAVRPSSAHAKSPVREEPGSVAVPPAADVGAVPVQARATLVQVKQEMRSLLELLGGSGNVVAPSPAPALSPPAPRPAPRRGKRS